YLSTLVGYWHLPNTGRFRKAAKVPYPNAYATPDQMKESKAHYLFNCAQRSHATFLELRDGGTVVYRESHLCKRVYGSESGEWEGENDGDKNFLYRDIGVAGKCVFVGGELYGTGGSGYGVGEIGAC
ncbi:MAG: hypothetical protein Q9204_008685, partial [Flavoplaca sp. TL-2023a]